ncbi:MAG: hypothetical protein CW338_04175 [Clostridiales bacterium]|nr:hypothetical protein [Clostridiales bacterium]
MMTGTAEKIKYGLVGHPLGHSVSPRIHALLGNTEYRLLDVEETELARLLTERNFTGLNVTIPYKQTVLPFCDELSEEVRAIGSANVLVNREGRIRAYNTDLDGFLHLMSGSGVSAKGKKAVILGSGGTSKMVLYALRSLGAVPVVISRRGPVTYDDLYRDHADARIIVNTTPVGMYPHTEEQAADLSLFDHAELVIDAVYNPERTQLLRQAENLGIRALGGLEMLVVQACRANSLFTGAELPGRERISEICDAVRASLFRQTAG